MILTDEQYEELDEWMEMGRKLGTKYPELQDTLITPLALVWKAHYQERGIDPNGRKFDSSEPSREENSNGNTCRW